MKIYIVEMFGYNGSHRYGAYSNIELAKNKLKEIFEEEKKDILNTEMIIRWNGLNLLKTVLICNIGNRA